MGWHLSGPVDVVLADNSDAPNAFALSRPRHQMVLRPIPPGPFSELGAFPDWHASQVAHEAVHLVHLDIVSGTSRALNALLGKTLLPNQRTPLWLKEGLATYLEGQLGGRGRLDSSIFKMYMRAYCQKYPNGPAVPSLDAISGPALQFPFGVWPYLYGGHFIQFLAARYGPDIPLRLAHSVPQAPLPFAINRSFLRTTGKSLAHLWTEFERHVRPRCQVIKRRRTETFSGARQISRPQRITNLGFGSPQNFRPRFSGKDKTVTFVLRHPERVGQVMTVDLRTKKTHTLFTENLIWDVTPIRGDASDVKQTDRTQHHVETSFVYTKAVGQRNFRRRLDVAFLPFRDAYIVNSAVDNTSPLSRISKNERLTWGQRVQNPVVSADGQWLLFTKLGADHSQLRIRPMNRPGSSRPILPIVPTLQKAIAPSDVQSHKQHIDRHPAISKDGAHVTFVRSDRNGGWDLWLLDVRRGLIRRLVGDGAVNASPTFTPDGRSIVYTSDKTGVFNLYSLDLDSGKACQLTDVTGGAFWPDVSPDGKTVVYGGFHASGMDVFTLDISNHTSDDIAKRRAHSTKIENRSSANGAATYNVNQTSASDPTRYTGAAYLVPRAWRFSFSNNLAGTGARGQVQTQATDPLFIHSIDAQLGLPLSGGAFPLGQRLDGVLGYAFRAFLPTVSASAARFVQETPGLALVRTDTLATDITVPFYADPQTLFQASLGYRHRRVRVEPQPNLANNPNTLFRVRPADRGVLAAGLLWDNVGFRRFSVTGQEGRRLTLDVEHALLGKRSSAVRTTLTWAWTEHLSPINRLHGFALGYRGGKAWTARGVKTFSLGGLPEQALLRASLTRAPVASQYLRGLQPATLATNSFHLVTATYHTPPFWIQRGLGTLPLFVRRTFGSISVDGGYVGANALTTDGRPLDGRLATFFAGIGLTSHTQFRVLYAQNVEIRLTLARGFGAGATTAFNIASAFNL